MFEQSLVINAFREITGADRVISDEVKLESFIVDQSFTPKRKPIAVVRPMGVKDVQEIINAAARHNIPVTPYSSGKNNQGFALPSAGGIILDMSGMKKITIDADNRNAVIEPGVTFDELQKEASNYGLRVLTPMELPGSASVLATYLEMNPLYAWPKYGIETLLTMELVLGNGKIMRTGNGASPFVKKPYDPHCNPYVILNKIWFGGQGTLAVATSASVILKDIPESNVPVCLQFDSVADAQAMIRDNQIQRNGEDFFIMNNTELALLIAKDREEVLAVKTKLAPWNLVLVVRGRMNEVEYQLKDLEDLIEKHGCIKMQGGDGLLKQVLDEIESPAGWEKFSKYKGARNTLQFMITVKGLDMVQKIAEDLCTKYSYPVDELGYTTLPVDIGRVVCTVSFSRNPEESEETERIKSLYHDLADELITQGAFFSRPPATIAKSVFERMPAYYNTLNEMKDIFDPARIMNPDKVFVI